jgi:RNA polymerase sigma-70 factor (ECF subfamily)
LQELLYNPPDSGVESLVPYSSLSAEDLVRKCAHSKDADAWRELVRRFHPVIAAAVLRTARRWCEPLPSLLDDLIQDTYLKLCNDHRRLLRSFRPEHPNSIYGFVQVMAANVVHDHFKAEWAGKRGAGRRTESISERVQSDPSARAISAGSSAAMERQIRLREIDEVLARVAGGPDCTRNSMIFSLYYRQGFTANEIAALPSLGLTTKGVESILTRLTHMIRSHITYEGFGRAKSL